jgi:hypothetical protein
MTIRQPLTEIQFSLVSLEQALESGKIYAYMHGTLKQWQCRRNGKTQTWKTRPNDWRIPVKAGLRSCGAITPSTLGHFTIEEA